jgi:hypothetical protein
MTTIDCPSCDHPLPVDLPLPATIRCDDCAVVVETADPEPVLGTLAA